MGKYNFVEDLAVAKKTEQEIALGLVHNYNMKLLKKYNTSDYDLLCLTPQGRVISIEVKEDFLCENTGNVALEFSCRGKPSGILVSKADYYIYKIHTKNGIIFIMFPTSELKDKIKKEDYFRIVNGGDSGSNTLSYLFKLSTFIDGGTIMCFSYQKEDKMT